MKFSHLLFVSFIVVSLVSSPLAFCEESGGAVSSEKPSPNSDTPWLEGVDIPTEPAFPTPQFSAEIQMPDGTPLPATMTEDIGVLFQVKSDIFDGPVPTSWKGQTLNKAEWVGKASVNWIFVDAGKNKSLLAASSDPLPLNQMKVTPLDPCNGKLTVFVSRAMRYEEEPGSFRRIYANGGTAHHTKVLDITPPLCGLEITLGGKQKGNIWTIENPLNHYPLPKKGDIIIDGEIFANRTEKTISGFDLGPKLIADPGKLTLEIPAKTEIKLKARVQDNDKIDDKSTRFGICELNNGIVKVIGKENSEIIDLSKLELPKEVYLFIESKDLSGNPGSLFLPIKIK